MRKMLFGAVPRVLVLLTVLVWSIAVAKEDPANAPKRDNSLDKTTGTPIARPLNINNFVTWMRATGQGNWTTQLKDGGFYPRGTSWVIYQDGFVFGGKPFLDAAKTQPAVSQPELRVGGQSYNVGTREGRIIGTGANANRADPAGADVRMYRIRRDWLQMGSDELKKDAAEVGEKLQSAVTQSDIDAILASYALDWNEWPVSYGAPFVERNGQAGYQKPPAFNYDASKGKLFTTDSLIAGKYDEPGIAGADPNSPADQVMWTAFNDLDPVTSQGFVGSDPLGLEFQCTIWGYKRADALGQLYFKKYRIINKGGVYIDVNKTQKGSFYIDSLYFCQWSDPDLGGSGDDLAGCDSTMSLGFVYNGNPIDSEYKKFGIPPPSGGYDFLQGPIVASPGDSAVFDLQIRQGYKNLPMTSFAYFSAGSPISDPAFTYEGARRWYRLLKGYVPDASTAPIRKFPHPPEFPLGQETFFPLSGDPVAQKGFVDGQGTDYSYSPGDRRILLNSGPVTMAPGDTQEVVVGVVGGLGSDRLSSVAVMKFNDEFVQNTYNALFAVPTAPPQPDVQAALLNEKVSLDWSSNVQRVKDIEEVTRQPGTYVFEGYNIYQYPFAGSPFADAIRIATYDLATDPAVILDRQFDVITGLILQVPIQFGTNSGVKRSFVLDRDYVRDINKLYNGAEYFVAVTAYAHSKSGFSPSALESAPIVYRVVPQGPKPGQTLGGAYGDTVKNVVQTAAPGGSLSEGQVIPIIVDPTKLTGHQYKVTFRVDTTTNATLWTLTDVTTGKAKLVDQTNQAGDDNYYVSDGLLVKVTGPSVVGMKGYTTAANGQRDITFAGADPTAVFPMEGYSGTIGNGYEWWFSSSSVGTDKLKNVTLKFAAADGTWDPLTAQTDPNFSRGYRYLRSASAAAAQPSFAPWIINPGAGYAYQDYNWGVPWAAYNVETTPPTRLMVGHLENNRAGGLVDGRYWPPTNATAGVDNTASAQTREWFFIFDVPYSTTPSALLTVDILNVETPLFWWGTVTRRAVAPNTAGNFRAGTEFNILANHPNTAATTFTFTAPLTTSGDAAMAKQDVAKINVYPNPYYAFNPQETSRLAKFVTFNKLPTKATLRIFNVAGQLVRVLEKDDDSQFLRWDLRNKDNFPVASGMYIVHVDMPAINATKVLKLAVIQEAEVPDVF